MKIGKNENGMRKSYKMMRGLFFSFFFFFFFALHFSERLKFVLGQSRWAFYTGKKYFTPGKKSGKLNLPPQKNIPVTPLSVASV